MPLPDGDAAHLDDVVLTSLRDAYQARADVKERMRSISEYEIARRMGLVELSYAEYADSDERAEVRAALSRLQSRGLVRATSVSGRYETFEPGESAMASEQAQAIPEPPAAPPPAGIEGRLDEIIRLLRRIDARLAQGGG